MIKGYNKKLENYLCFSLILKLRSLDFYCEPDKIDFWVIALSNETKNKNSKAYCLRPG